jgi:FRG domain
LKQIRLNNISELENWEMENKIPNEVLFYRGQKVSVWPLISSLLNNIINSKYKLSNINKIDKSNYDTYSTEEWFINNRITNQNIIAWQKMERKQHLDSGTSLLDITNLLLVALHFATEGDFDKDGKIWVFRNANNKMKIEDSNSLSSIDPFNHTKDLII